MRCGETSPADTVSQQQDTRKSLVRMQSIVARHLELGNIYDPLLAINFARWVGPPKGRGRGGAGRGRAGQGGVWQGETLLWDEELWVL